jgi:pimeloyl-ACP methyl ester carboxylesterase
MTANPRFALRSIVVILLIGAARVSSAASVDGIPLHWTSAGAGPQTLMLVHGWTCDDSSWSGQLPALTRQYRVLTLDLPGHGKSGRLDASKFSMDLFARAVEAVRAEAGADRLVLVGHSMGTPVIRQYARLYPQRVAALVIVDGVVVLGAPPRPGVQPAQAPVADRMKGPDGPKNREAMIRGMFTPATPKPLQDHVLKMMLAAPEATAYGADGGHVRSEDLGQRRDDDAGARHLRGQVGARQPRGHEEDLPQLRAPRGARDRSLRDDGKAAGVQPAAHRVRGQAGHALSAVRDVVIAGAGHRRPHGGHCPEPRRHPRPRAGACDGHSSGRRRTGAAAERHGGAGHAGLDDAVAAAGAALSRAVLLDPSGRPLGPETRIERIFESPAARVVALHRARLHDVLLGAAGNAVVRTGVRVAGFEQTPDRVVVMATTAPGSRPTCSSAPTACTRRCVRSS